MIYKVCVAYDGSNYAGWQKQINALGVQEVIEKALRRILKSDVDIVASGRTDAKVHATGQVFHFESDSDIPCTKYKEAMNALLPKDIRIKSVQAANDDFHARFCAKRKRYEYFCTYEKENPFVYPYKEILLYPIDIKKMQEAAKVFLGVHDFTSFSSSKIDPRKPREKNIYQIDIRQEDKDIHFIFEGNGFLRYQVRMMVGTLLAVGRDKIKTADIQKMLDARDKEACRYNASPQGLYLTKVYYEENLDETD